MCAFARATSIAEQEQWPCYGKRKLSVARSPGQSPQSWSGSSIGPGLRGGPSSDLRSGSKALRGFVCALQTEDLGSSSPSSGTVRAWGRNEDRLTVVAQFVDALANIGQGPVSPLLLRTREVHPWVPPSGEFLDARDVDHAVMQVRVESRHVASKEAAICGDSVPAQGGLSWFGHVTTEHLQEQILGLFDAHPLGQFREQARRGVHLADDVEHARESVVGRLDHEVDAVVDHVEVGIGDQHRHFDEGIGPEIETGHLTVDPDQCVNHGITLEVAEDVGAVSASDVRHLDTGCLLAAVSSEFGVPICSSRPNAVDGRVELSIDHRLVQALADYGTEVVSARGEEARVHLSDCREARSGARSTERLSDRCDDAEFTRAIEVAEARRNLAWVGRIDRLDRPVVGDALHDLNGGNDVLCLPSIAATDVHVFNEADDMALGSGEFGEQLDLVVIHPAADHYIDLERRETRINSRVDTGQDLLKGGGCVGDLFEPPWVERIETHGDSMQTRRTEGARKPSQEGTVRRKGKIFHARYADKHGDQSRKVSAQRGFPPCDSNLAHSCPDEGRCDPCDLLECQQLLLGQEPEIRPENFARHAVAATHVAPVRHRDAQISERTVESVAYHRGHPFARPYDPSSRITLVISPSTRSDH